MKVCTCFLLFGIFAYTNSIARMRSKENHRVVNVPQETDTEDSNEEYSGDTINIDNVRNFTKGTTGQNTVQDLAFRAPRVETLTDFIEEAVKILNTYEDTAFEDFFHVLDNEIRKYHYKGCKFSELMQDSDTRIFLAGSLNLIRGQPVSFTKANINVVADMIRDETYGKNVKELLDYINSLYRNTELNFGSVLNELEYYRNTKSVKTHNNLVQVIKDGVRAVLFNPYSELNTKTRRELKERIEIFWDQFKNNPASSLEINDIPNSDVIIDSFEVSENTINEVKKPETYSKNEPQIKFKNKREKIVSINTYGEQFHRDEAEKDENSNESGDQITDNNTDEISSGQSFDSSSNSIKNSQERHEEYNTQRYMTLYAEEISYKAKTTKKTEIIPISASVMTRRPTVKKRQTTTSTPREKDVSSDTTEEIEMLRANSDTDDTNLDISNSSYDTESGLTLESKHEPRARENYDKQQKQGKADDSRYNITLYSKSAIQTEPVPINSTIRRRYGRVQAEIRPHKSTAQTKPLSRFSKRNKTLYSKQLRDLKKNIAPPLLNEEHPVDQYMKDKNENQKYLRRSGNDTFSAEDFNTYVIKRINDLENKLNELQQMNDFSIRSRINDNNTNGVEARNVTDKLEVKDKVDNKRKDMKGNVIKTLLNDDQDLNNQKVNNGHDFPIRKLTMNTESFKNKIKSRKLNVIKKDAFFSQYLKKKIPQVTKINVKVTEKLNKEVINNNVTTSTISLVKVTNETKLESVVTTPMIRITRRQMAYSKPSYYDSQEENSPTVADSQFDQFFAHLNDGMELHM